MFLARLDEEGNAVKDKWTYRCRNGQMTPSQQGKGEQMSRGSREANRQEGVLALLWHRVHEEKTI